MNNNKYAIGIGAIFDTMVCWPINKLINMRKDNIALAAVPAIISLLTRKEAAREIRRLVTKLLR